MKTITRDEAIAELIEAYLECTSEPVFQIKKLIRFGHKGFDNFTNEELEAEFISYGEDPCRVIS